MSDGETTTDALPSPPRIKKEFNHKKENPTRIKVEENDDKFKKDFDDTSPKQSPKQAVIGVVNMNIVNATNVHVGDNVTYRSGSMEDQKPRTSIIETELIRSLKKCNKAVTREDISFVSEHMMVTGWRNTARALNYSDGQIQKFEYRHPLDIRETIYDLILDWIQYKGPKVATVAFLAEILWCMKQREVVKLWSEQYETIHSK